MLFTLLIILCLVVYNYNFLCSCRKIRFYSFTLYSVMKKSCMLEVTRLSIKGILLKLASEAIEYHIGNHWQMGVKCLHRIVPPFRPFDDVKTLAMAVKGEKE